MCYNQTFQAPSKRELKFQDISHRVCSNHTACMIGSFWKRKWLQNHPWMLLFQGVSKLIRFDHHTSHDAVRIKLSVCHSTGDNLAAYHLGSRSNIHVNVSEFASRLGTFPFCNTDCFACVFQFVRFFFTFFKTLQTFASGVSVRLVFG